MTRQLWLLYGFAFFNKFLLLSPVYAIFMQAHGLTDFQLSTMFIVSAAATVLGQAPTAYLTNRLGQRFAMIFGQILKIVAVLLWLIMPTYLGFIIGMVLWGVQSGFRSVAFEGLLYDVVASYDATDEYPRILGRKSTFESVGTALSACGSLLMVFGYDWVTYASVLAIVASIICLMFVRIRKSAVSNVPRIRFSRLLRSGLRVCLKTPCLLSVMLLTLLVINIPYLDDFLSPIGLQLGIPTEYVGVLSFFLLGCATLGQRFAYRFTHLSNWTLCALIMCVGIGYIAFGVIYTSGALWLMGVAYTLFYGIYTLLYAQFQNMIPPRHRSVVLSLFTTLTYMVYIVTCGIIGLGGNLGSWRYSIVIQGVLVLMVALWAFVRVSKKCDLTVNIPE